MAWSTPATITSGQAAGLSTAFNTNAADLAVIGASWTTYAPVLTAATANPTGYTTSGSAWMQAGKLTFFRIVVTMGAAVGTGAYSVTLPAAPRNAGLFRIDGVLYDTSSGNSYPAFLLVGSGSATCGIYVLPTTAGNPFAAATPASPITVATGDVWTFNGEYEAV